MFFSWTTLNKLIVDVVPDMQKKFGVFHVHSISLYPRCWIFASAGILKTQSKIPRVFYCHLTTVTVSVKSRIKQKHSLTWAVHRIQNPRCMFSPTVRALEILWDIIDIFASERHVDTPKPCQLPFDLTIMICSSYCYDIPFHTVH